MGAEVPWVEMLDPAVRTTIWVVVFGIVVAWMLMETAVECLHAMLDHVEQNMGDLP